MVAPSILFSPGFVVRVLPDTTPGVRPMHAEGMLMARVSCYAGDGDYFVTPTSSKKRRRVSGSLLFVEVHDQLTSPHTITNPCVLSDNLVLQVPFSLSFRLDVSNTHAHCVTFS